MGNDWVMFKTFKEFIMLEFDMSDLSKMHYFHSIEVVQCLAEIFIFSKETCPINFRHISSEELQSHHYSN